MSSKQESDMTAAVRGADGRLFLLLAAALFLLPLIYTPFTYDVFAIGKATFLRLAGAAVLLFIAVDLLRGRFRLAPSSGLYLAAVFFGLVLLAALTSVHIPTSVFGLRNRLFGIITYLPIFAFFLAAVKVRWSRERVILLFQAISLAALLVSLIGIAQALGATFPADLKFKFGQAGYSTFGNPNMVGVFLVMSVPIALALAGEDDRRTRLFGSIAAAAIVGGIWATQSAGAWLTGTVIIVAYGLLHGYRKKMFSYTQLAALALVGVVIAGALGTLIVNREDQQFRDRLETWKAATSVMADFPLTGSGPDTMRFVVQERKSPIPGVDREIPEDAHNVFLTIGATMGIPALIIFMAMLVVAGRRLLGAGVDESWDRRRAALFLSLTAYLLAEMINPDNIVNLTFFWILIGVALALTTKVGPRSPFKAGPAVAALLVPVALAMIVSSVPLLMSEYFLKRGERAVNAGEIVAAYRTSQRLNPYGDWYQIRLADRFFDEIEVDPQTARLVIGAASRAVELSPLEADNHQILGAAYHNRARTEGDKSILLQAVSSYERSLELNPYKRTAAQNLLLAYEELEMSAEAAALEAHWTQLDAKL